MTGHHEGRPPHPNYGPPMSGPPISWGGVLFRAYKTGVMDSVRCSDDFRITVRGAGVWSTGYQVNVDGVTILGPSGKPKRFRSQHAAAEAGVKLLKRKERG